MDKFCKMWSYLVTDDSDRLDGILDLLEDLAWVAFKNDKERENGLLAFITIPHTRLKALKTVCTNAKEPLLRKFDGSTINEIVTLTTKAEDDEEILASILTLMPEPKNLLECLLKVQKELE